MTFHLHDWRRAGALWRDTAKPGSVTYAKGDVFTISGVNVVNPPSVFRLEPFDWQDWTACVRIAFDEAPESAKVGL